MFESDDFDQVLSQFELPEFSNPKEKDDKNSEKENLCINKNNNSSVTKNDHVSTVMQNNERVFKTPDLTSPKHSKRKMINSLFNSNSKRKFPGPAGLLTGSLEENHDDNICHIQILSQDVDFSENNSNRNVFESPLWMTLIDNVQNWNLGNMDTIKAIKEQALVGNLQKRKAKIVTAFVEAVDRTAIDPLIILRDKSGSIKCTLHRDAWLAFSSYIASEYCAIILTKPTVLTTGGAFKKHYLNITLSNIYAIYSSAVIKDDADSKPLIEGYTKEYEEDFTIIKTKSNMDHNDENLLGDIDSSIFLEDVFKSATK